MRRGSEERLPRGGWRARVAREAQVTEKVAARTFTKGFLSELQSQVVQNLSDAGFFFDPLEAEVTNTFMPWLLDSMTGKQLFPRGCRRGEPRHTQVFQVLLGRSVCAIQVDRPLKGDPSRLGLSGFQIRDPEMVEDVRTSWRNTRRGFEITNRASGVTAIQRLGPLRVKMRPAQALTPQHSAEQRDRYSQGPPV